MLFFFVVLVLISLMIVGTKCKYEFCYECGADYQRILRTDNSAHAEDCRFHSP